MGFAHPQEERRLGVAVTLLLGCPAWGLHSLSAGLVFGTMFIRGPLRNLSKAHRISTTRGLSPTK